VAKIPMQFFVLFIGAMVFVFYLFVQPPVLFQQTELGRIQHTAAFSPLQSRYADAFGRRREAALRLIEAHHAGDSAAERRQAAEYRGAQRDLDASRTQASRLVEQNGGERGFSDTNYIFLSFVTRYLPSGLVGLVIAVMFAATMSASAGEINSLATVSMVDLYRRHFRRDASDHHYLMASRWATIFWGAYAVASAGFGHRLGSLIVAVNVLGSLFYGSLLGVFVLAFLFRGVHGTGAFWGMLLGEATVLTVHFLHLISFLWYNVIGCAVVILTALAITWLSPKPVPEDRLVSGR
jgi:Na+(H+)/acetate symporter ActP